MEAPGLQELAEVLSDTFETRVKVELGRRKGRIVVEFGSLEDLERIVALMAPDAHDRRRRGSEPPSPAQGITQAGLRHGDGVSERELSG
jgi:ParB family chromosome partitioning protein